MPRPAACSARASVSVGRLVVTVEIAETVREDTGDGMLVKGRREVLLGSLPLNSVVALAVLAEPPPLNRLFALGMSHEMHGENKQRHVPSPTIDNISVYPGEGQRAQRGHLVGVLRARSSGIDLLEDRLFIIMTYSPRSFLDLEVYIGAVSLPRSRVVDDAYGRRLAKGPGHILESWKCLSCAKD